MDKHDKVFCVISHTHWDREWYMPLENFRHRLTDLMDRLLIILDENPDYIFHLDAQTVVLEDYLAVRPEKKAILKKHISDRRIIIGPWYLQNDFYLTSGEATVRNLLEGQKLCREFGGSSKAGYAADQFGNMDQLPQIMHGFGIDNFIFGRGFARYDVNEKGEPVHHQTPTEFIWKGADGSRVLAIHMRHWYNNAQRFSSDPDKAYKHLCQIESWYDNDFTFTPYILLMNGVDHLEPQPDIIQVTEAVQKKLPEGKYFLQYNLDDYVDAVKKYVDDNGVKLDEVEGELRKSWDITVLQGTLSSRHYLKVANCEAQILLENRIEPLYSMMEKQGMKGIYPHDRLVYTWKNLLRNHPHDSICGCSHDAVHAHMENRYEEIFEFAGEQLRRAMNDAAEHMAATREGLQRDYLVTVANTLSVPLSGGVKVKLNMLVSDDMESFKIVNDEGKEVAFKVLSKIKRSMSVYSPINLPGQVDVFSYEVYLDAGRVEPFAFKTFTVTAGDSTPKVTEIIEKTGNAITNGILSLSVDDDGRVDLTDVKSGRVIKDCLKVEDMADAGESYGFELGGDSPIYSDSFKKEVTLKENNEFVSRLEIKYTMELPEHYCADKRVRSDETAVSTLTLGLSLYKDEPFARVDYTLDNASKDHRLRLAFDADVSREESFADIPFNIVSHTAKDFYPTTQTKTSPNTAFAAIQDGKKGMAVFTVGAHEYEHQNGNRLLFTIVRATGEINHGATDGWIVPGNQCLRTIKGRMAICPFEGDLISADIVNKSLSFRAPLMAGFTACDTRKFAGGRPCVQDTEISEFFYLPDVYPEVSIESNTEAIDVKGEGVTVSAFKISEDESGLILRLVNYCDKASTAEVTSKGKIFKTALSEIPHEFLGRDKVKIDMRAKEILTLYLDR